ncbi:MAG: hypothetical protein COB41_05030 [Proteobacteria bacterium]|nr:MAG: hypothetical protein COB41_05030 [Pseudomonadota bacterium]
MNMFKYLTLCLIFITSTSSAFSKEIKNDWMGSYTLEASGEYEKAASLLVPYMGVGERSEFATLRYAWLNYLQGNFNDAARAYKKAMAQNPRSLDAKLGLTLPLMAQQRWREAMRYIKQVLAQAPLNYTAHSRLLVCEEGLREWQELEKHAKNVAAFYPTDANALVYLARSYAWQDKTLLAKSIYNKVLIRIPSHLEALQFIKNNP